MVTDYKLKTMAAIAETMKAYTSGDVDRPWVLSYSGGKDSTVTADIVFRTLIQLKKHNPNKLKRQIYLLTAQTCLDLVTDPLKQEELMKIGRVIREYMLPVEVKEVSAPPEKSFMYLTLGKGYPLPKSRVNRWCTERLKIEPIQKEMKRRNPEIQVTGVRLSETTERRRSIESRQVSEYYTDNVFMPIVNFTLDDVWSYLLKEKTSWGDAEKISQLYKDATGECGLSKRRAGAGEKVDDPCGARTGCIICPVVTIDKSSKEFAKTHPWLQPYVDLRNTFIAMYKDERNKAGRMRDGTILEYGKGTFTVKARMKLYELVKQAESDNEYLARMHGVEPQKLIYSQELDDLIKKQWEEDLRECPWVEDAMEVGRYFETKIKGLNGFQMVWNHHYDSRNTV
ncbi:phosphoadenosine phosphosulfate reductase family protein [Paenibacillus sp. RC84]|uniref:phosphoadenosine phosphosulfate reductase domain-containing protein n=1 Tax=Paenibacillus sp. RC84 TaxID=3156252 RepID=UPI0035168F2A